MNCVCVLPSTAPASFTPKSTCAESEIYRAESKGRPVQDLRAKIFILQISENQQSSPYPASLAEGRIAVVTNVRRGCGGREGAD
jgi:hypothetical protein